MKRKKDFIKFRDPNIPDRDMLCLILFEMAKLHTEIKFVREYIEMDKSQITTETHEKLFDFCSSQAFAEMQADMLVFIRAHQKRSKGTGKNLFLN
jgi:hypothetical protein